MSDYDFSTLNPIDFEKLVCDLLNIKIEARYDTMFRSFKEGKDKGVDLLFSTKKKDFEVVVQIKHYYKSSYSTLKRDLIKSELDKVKKINPSNYIFVTSLSLSIHNKEEIKKIFHPYINNLQDILGKDDLNDILRLNKSIEEKHFKLWFSSSVALQKILQYKFIGRKNEFQESEIKRKLRLFVNTKELALANQILNNNKFLIITGEPGVGKTTLSEILIYKFLSRDFDLTVIYDDIREIELVIKNDNSKQIFYFDDFLGHTQAEISKSKSAETSLLKIISRIEKEENKYLILNTRKFILNSFLEESERFRNFNPLRSESKIELVSYSYGAKRRMLDNHLNESELNFDYLQVLKDHAYFICNHKNFSPRHLEFYTSKYHINELGLEKFKNFIVENLENPRKIWEHAYINQINDLDRFLLNTLFSLGTITDIKTLEIAFINRLNFEVKNNNLFKPIDPFKDCLRRLNDGFIVSVKSFKNISIDFINPSLEDYLRFFIENNNFELERILFSSVNIEQWYSFSKPYDVGEKKISQVLIDYFSQFFVNRLISNIDKYKASIFILYNNDKKTTIVGELLRQIDDWDFIINNPEINHYSFKFLQHCKDKKILNYTISKLDYSFFLNTILACNYIEEIYEIIHVFKNHFDIDFKTNFDRNSIYYGQYRELIKEIYSSCELLLKKEVETQYNFLLKNIDKDGHVDVIERIDQYFSFIKLNMFDDFKVDYTFISYPNWNEIAEHNYTNFLINGNLYDSSKYLENDDDYSNEYFYVENDEDYDYDFEKERIASFGVVEFDEEDFTDLPF